MSVAPAYAAGGQNGNLSGVVVDATSKAGVAGAKITIASPSGRYTATTDGGGRFTINGATVDSYTLSVEAPGYEAYSSPGITIQGDGTVSLGSIPISKTLRTITRTTSRSASGAYQPNQTIDSYTVSGARATQALGKQENTNETQLLLSVPGVSQTNSGDVTIRGGLQNEIGYQLNGVPYTEPFLSHNGSNGRINGLGSAQVVEGAGDATQGNIGSGLVNVIPKSGTYPGEGLADVEFGGPSFDHQAGIEYGIATRSGNISNYFSYVGERDAPYQGYFNQNAAYLGQSVSRTSNEGLIGYFGSSLEYNDDLLDNFIVRFGKDNRQSLQVLYNTRDLQQYGEVGGLTDRLSYLYDPYTQNVNGNPFPGDPATAAALYGAYTGLTPYTQTTAKQITQSQVVSASPTKLLNFQYNNNLDDKTFFTLRYYNFFGQNTTSSLDDGDTDPTVSITGGQRVGGNFELTHTIGQHTITLQGQLENQHPQWNEYAPVETLDLIGFGGVNGLSVNDFLPAVDNGGTNGWVYQHLGQTRLPTVGINYNGSDFQTSGFGLRDQWSLNSRVKFDYGVRVDHANYKYGANPYNPDLSNPSDVDPSFITNDVLHPTVVDPRFAVSVQPTTHDAVRFSYGRSVEFLNAQDAGTPGGLYGAEALANVPVTPGTNDVELR
jgi:outer membrane receptor protein involved in Fe transport